MKIGDLEFFCVAVPRGNAERRVASMLVRIASDTGLEGWGEGQLDWRPSELVDRRQALLPLLAGRSVYDLAELVEFDALGTPPLRSAIEMACWDLIGREARQPLANLWGGFYRGRVSVSVRLAGDDPAALAERSREWSAHGFHQQILAARDTVEETAAHVKAILEAAGDRAEYCLDGRARFDLDSARELCYLFEKSPRIRQVIDAARDADIELTSQLRRQTKLALGLHRSVRSPGDAMWIARKNAARGAVVELDRVGGISAARDCAAVVTAGDALCSLAAPRSIGPGLLALLQLAAATPCFGGANECVYPELRDSVLAGRLDVSDGTIAVPDGPGLGVELDRAKIERYLIA